MTSPGTGNRDTTFAILSWYEKALKGIGKPEATKILATHKLFVGAWQQGEPVEMLKARYDFKQVASSKQCRQRGNLFQVRFIRNYRALLCFSNDGTTAWWLDVFVKNPTEQKRRIETACQRALRIMEQHTP